MTYPREYHSIALLTPIATVIVGGGQNETGVKQFNAEKWTHRADEYCTGIDPVSAISTPKIRNTRQQNTV